MIFKKGLTPRATINGAIFLLALLLLFFVGHGGWRTWQMQQSAQQRQSMSQIGTLSLRLAALRAMERGLTMALLRTGQRPDQEFQSKLLKTRHAGDQVREELIEALQQWIHGRSGNVVLDVLLADEIKNNWLLLKARKWLDQHPDQWLQEIGREEWFKVITHANRDAKNIQQTVSALTSAETDNLSNHRAISGWAAHASELAGRVRGLLTFYVGERQPIPPQVRDQLYSFSREAEHLYIHTAPGRAQA